MTPTGLEPLFVSVVPGRISHRKETGQRHYALAPIFTGLAAWSSGSSIRLSTVGVWRPATTSSRPITLHSSSLRQYAYASFARGLLRFAAPRWIESKHDLTSLSPQVGFVAAEAVERERCGWPNAENNAPGLRPSS
jgi:hypothetical protein